MHNWWLASLEHFGLITRTQAEHIANEIKTSIHRDKYSEAYEDLTAILGRVKGSQATLVSGIESKIDALEGDIADALVEIEKLKTLKPVPRVAKAQKPIAAAKTVV